MTFPLRGIVMFHTGRCGSLLLATMLKQHPKVHWAHEVFRPDLLEEKYETYSCFSPFELLHSMMAAHFESDNGDEYFGFEIQLPQLDPLGLTVQAVLDHLEMLNTDHIIALKRKNHLHRIVSSSLGHLTSRWHLHIQQEPLLSRFELDIENLTFRGITKPLLDHLQEERARFRTLEEISKGQEALQLTYEDDILCDPRCGYRRTCEFVGLEPIDATVRFRKTNPFKLSEVILNFDEVGRTLKDTEFEWMLY